MASGSEVPGQGGTKRRATLIPRVRTTNPENTLNLEELNNSLSESTENGRDSGLSSESTTPTGGSPPPRQPKISPVTLTNSILSNRAKGTDGSRISSSRTPRLLRSRTGTDSPRSLDGVRTRQVPSPFRPLITGNGQSPSLDSSDEGSPRFERCNYHQDIVYIKTGLLKLMRVIQESEEKDLTRADTLNPFSNTMMNGLFHNLNEEGTTDSSVTLANGALHAADELADLRRQVIFLQGQLEDKDRAIQQLQLQVAKQQELINSTDSQSNASSIFSSNTSSIKDLSNAATQTEKIRPVSAGPSLLQGFPQDSSMGPLVSWSEPWNHQSSPSQHPPSLVELNSTNNKNLRKLSDRLPRTAKSRVEQLTTRLNGDAGLENNLSIRKVSKPREIPSTKIIDSTDIKESPIKSDIPKSCIPSLKKASTLTLIPRVARTAEILVTARSHNS